MGPQSQTLSDLASRHRDDCHLQLKTAPFRGGEWNEKKTHATTHILVALWVQGITRRLPGSFADGVCHELSQQKSTQERRRENQAACVGLGLSPSFLGGRGAD